MASIFDSQILSKSDLEKIKQLSQLWLESTDAAQREKYHQAAEAIRNSYGYSGGADGSKLSDSKNSVIGIALATKNYVSELEKQNEQKEKDYEKMLSSAQSAAGDRLRQAYVKNMQSTLGLDQKLKAQGVTGGLSESTAAAMKGQYLNVRDGILKDSNEQNIQIQTAAKQQKDAIAKEISKAEYDSAQKRVEELEKLEQKEYDRAKYEYERKYKEQQDEKDRQWEQKLFDYQKALDKYDREYKEKNDQLDRQTALAKASAGKSTTTKDTQKEQLIKSAWELLEKGVYDESFPELLGFSKEILLEYAQNSMAGF